MVFWRLDGLLEVGKRLLEKSQYRAPGDSGLTSMLCNQLII